MRTSLVLFALALAQPLHAQIVTFSFTGALGNEASFAPDAQPTGAVVSSMSRGSGLTPSTTADTFNSSAWTTAASIDFSDYYTFTITPDPGYFMTLSSLQLDERRSGTGIRSWAVRSSLDSFSSNLSLFSVPDDTSVRTAQTTSFSSAFESLTSGVELRLYGFSAESGSGTWRIDNVQVSGSLTAAPEPHEYALVASLGLVGFAAYRRWSERKNEGPKEPTDSAGNPDGCSQVGSV